MAMLLYPVADTLQNIEGADRQISLPTFDWKS